MTDSKSEKKVPRTMYKVIYWVGDEEHYRYFAEKKDALVFKNAVHDREAQVWFKSIMKEAAEGKHRDAQLYQAISPSDAKQVAENAPALALASEIKYYSAVCFDAIPATSGRIVLSAWAEKGAVPKDLFEKLDTFRRHDDCFVLVAAKPQDLVRGRRTVIKWTPMDIAHSLPDADFAKKALALLHTGDKSEFAPADIRMLYDCLVPDYGEDEAAFEERRACLGIELLY